MRFVASQFEDYNIPYITFQAQPSLYGTIARELVWWACTGGKMTAHDVTMRKDRIYEMITMGLQDKARKEGWLFSSCAYLPLWMYECLGIADNDAKLKRTGKPDNPLSRVSWHKKSESIYPTGLEGLDPGDAIQIGSNGDSHIYVACEAIDDWTILAAEYGSAAPVGGKTTRYNVRRPTHSIGYPEIHGRKPARRILRLKSLEALYGSVIAPIEVYDAIKNQIQT